MILPKSPYIIRKNQKLYSFARYYPLLAGEGKGEVIDWLVLTRVRTLQLCSCPIHWAIQLDKSSYYRKSDPERVALRIFPSSLIFTNENRRG
jgi:hypothetical protein